MSTPSWTPPPSHPNPPLQAVSKHWVGLPVTHSKFPLAIYFTYSNVYVWASQVAQLEKNPPAKQETLVRFLGQEDSPKKG